MGRYIKDIELNQPIDVVSMVMDDYVYHERFGRTDWNGEMVYSMKDRHGRERYMKWHYTGGVFHVEAWLKGAFGGEMDLDGVGGGASRKEYHRSIEQLLKTLQLHHGGQLSGGHVGSDPLHHSEDHKKDHTQWKKDTNWQGSAADAVLRTAKSQFTAQTQRQKVPAPQTQKQTVPVSQIQRQTVPDSQTQRRIVSVSEAQQALGTGTTQLLVYAVLSLLLAGAAPFFGFMIAVIGIGKVKKNGEQTTKEIQKLVKILFGIAISIAVIRCLAGMAMIFAELIDF